MNATGGEPDIAGVATLFADPTRARVLMALVDGRALPASVLASEAGVTPQALSSQLSRLLSTGFLEVERSGRYRYYRISDPRVISALEALAPLASVPPVTSLRQSTRAGALRAGRTCYDHLAGRLGAAVTQGLIDRGALVPEDGIRDNRRRDSDPLSSQLRHHPYRLGDTSVLVGLGVPRERLDGSASRRPLLRFCLDWTEQRHHLAGRLGSDLLAAFTGAGWVTRASGNRAVRVTPAGATALRECLGIKAG
ncbi:MAG: helix-turn-helix transcriptional regulator [Nocardiopsaceae bacterium]|nr:helix-turn-helix transcriptional regulator [Nocardiopsaceae bacterium]